MLNLRFASLCAALASVALAACDGDAEVIVDDPGPDASLTVTNNSDFAIVEIRVTEVDNSSWGDNLLRGDTLEPGEQLTLNADCGTYDALLVDEDGVDCELHSVDLCLNDADWVIGNNTCAVFGAARAQREAAAKAAAEAANASTGSAN